MRLVCEEFPDCRNRYGAPCIVVTAYGAGGTRQLYGDRLGNALVLSRFDLLVFATLFLAAEYFTDAILRAGLLSSAFLQDFAEAQLAINRCISEWGNQ